MKRYAIVLLILSLFSCVENLPTSNPNLPFLGYLAKVALENTQSISTGIPKVIATDFISNTTLAPVVISKTQTLGVTFDTPMNITGCTVKVNGNSISSTVTSSSDKKTLFFKANTGLDVNLLTTQKLEISSDCKSEGGTSYIPESGVYVYVADNLLYVDASAGNDSNPGTMTNPMKSLSSAVIAMNSACTGALACALALKGGVYLISSKIMMPFNLSLFGGFDPSDWKIRRADKTSLPQYDTIITDTSTGVTGTGPDPYSSIKFFNHTGTKEKSIIDGIIVNGPVSANAGSYLAPIGIVNLQSGAGVTIRNTVTNDLSSTLSVTSVGFVSANNSGSINLTNSKFNASIVAGSSSTTHGIVYNGSTATSEIIISNCDIDAGISTTSSSGFFPSNTINGIVTLYKNTITSRNCSGCDSIGVTANFATANGMSISENTINSGSGLNSYGINFTGGTGISISNNTITSGTAGTVSAPINFTGTTSTATVANNVLTTGSCTNASCKMAGIIHPTSSFPTLNVSGNTITVGSCSASSCTGFGISLANGTAATNTTISNNTILMGSANTGGSFGMQMLSTLANQNHTITGNTITGGTASGNQITAIYRGNASAGATVNISNNIATTGNCTGSCINRAFDIQNVSGTTTISGNTVTAGSGSNQSVGIELNNSSFTVTNNIVTSGSCTSASCFSNGINCGFGSPVTLTGNTVTAGTCAGSTCAQTGVSLTVGSGPVITLSNNTIDSGIPSASNSTRTAFNLSNWANGTSIQRNTFINRTGAGTPTAVKLAGTSTSLQFCSNVLIGGTRTNAGNATTLEIGLITGGAKFKGNTIVGANISSGTVYPVNFLTTGNHTNLNFDQNLIAGDPASAGLTTGIRESGAVIYPTLNANNLSSVSTLYNENGIIRNFLCTSTQIGNFSDVNVACSGTPLSSPTGVNNTNLTPVFVNPSLNDYHLHSSTPTGITQAMTSGELTTFSSACGNSLDRDGNTRVANSSIGAYK